MLTKKECKKRFVAALHGNKKRRDIVMLDWALAEAEGFSQNEVAELFISGCKGLDKLSLAALFKDGWERYCCDIEKNADAESLNCSAMQREELLDAVEHA